MARRGRYYLGRIVKSGRLDEEKLLAAIQSPATITVGRFAWTITDVVVGDDPGRIEYIYGQLTKFHPRGVVRVIDDTRKSSGEIIEPNLLIATSPFIYIPEFSGIAYLHVWNQIEKDTFPKRFVEIIKRTYNNFFLDCSIEPISDLRHFAAKLASIEAFIEISAKVYPPNPLFGRAWKDLKEYIQRRMASEVDIKEKADEDKRINTKLVEHVQGIMNQTEKEPYEPSQPVDIADAAVLMAADGYGSGKVVGKEKDSVITIRTAETHKSFLFRPDAHAKELFSETIKHFKKISKDRDMKH